MAVKQEAVGYFDCATCHDTGEVVPFKKGGGFFTRCQCGTDQRRGEKQQQWIAENRRDALMKKEVEKVAKKEIAKVDDDDKKDIDKAAKKEPEKQEGFSFWLLAIPVVLIGLVVAKAVRAKDGK